jgi:N-methylhydantoinase B
MLGYGLPWNDGLLRPLGLTVPEGTLLNCAFPAPVSMGTVAASRMATVASWTTISSMLAMSGGYADELSAQWSASSYSGTASGTTREGRYFVLPLLTNVGGGGARRYADGVDSSGGSSNPNMSMPNVETLERNGPILLLFRRQMRDSGGPGTFRGGVSTEAAWISHKARHGHVEGELHGSGREPAMSRGLFGGFPGCNTLFEVRSGTRLRAVLAHENPVDLEALGGDVQQLPIQSLFEVDEASILHVRADGGGAVGDPLLRAPGAVLADVQAGLVSVEQARDTYGVVLAEHQGAVDAAATERQRLELRTGRLGHLPSQPLDGRGVLPPVRYDAAGGAARCGACARALGPVEEDWKRHVVEQVQPVAALGALMTSTLFVLRSYSCPDCGALLDAEMTRPEDPPVHLYSPLPRDD